MSEPMPDPVNSLRLHPEDRKAIVVELAALLQKRAVRASTLAKLYDVSTDYIYDHAEELGARYLGTKTRKSDKTRMVFDLATADAWMASRAKNRSEKAGHAVRRGRRRPNASTPAPSIQGFEPIAPVPRALVSQAATAESRAEAKPS